MREFESRVRRRYWFSERVGEWKTIKEKHKVGRDCFTSTQTERKMKENQARLIHKHANGNGMGDGPQLPQKHAREIGEEN